jgi:hypothetical protein
MHRLDTAVGRPANGNVHIPIGKRGVDKSPVHWPDVCPTRFKFTHALQANPPIVAPWGLGRRSHRDGFSGSIGGSKIRDRLHAGGTRLPPLRASAYVSFALEGASQTNPFAPSSSFTLA